MIKNLSTEVNKLDGLFIWNDKTLPDKKDLKAHIKLAHEVMDDWKGIEIDWINISNLAGLGGAITYKVFIETDKIPKEKNNILENIKFLSVVLHSTISDKTDRFEDEKMRQAHRLLFRYDLIVPRLYEGKDWWIERFIENDRTEVLSIETYATLLADLHSLPTDWYNTFYDQYTNEYPELKEAHPHGHVWTYVAKPGWFMPYRTFETYLKHEDHFVPQTEAGKRIVNVHSDYWNDNILYDKGLKKAYVIDLEYISVGWAARDLAFIFWWIEHPGHLGVFLDMKPDKSMTNYEAIYLFTKTYQKRLNYPHEKLDIENLIFDAECAKLRHFHCILAEDNKIKKTLDPNYDHDFYKEHVRIEKLAKNDDTLKNQVIQKGIYKAVVQTSPNITSIKQKIEKLDKYKVTQLNYLTLNIPSWATLKGLNK